MCTLCFVQQFIVNVNIQQFIVIKAQGSSEYCYKMTKVQVLIGCYSLMLRGNGYILHKITFAQSHFCIKSYFCTKKILHELSTLDGVIIHAVSFLLKASIFYEIRIRITVRVRVRVRVLVMFRIRVSIVSYFSC